MRVRQLGDPKRTRVFHFRLALKLGERYLGQIYASNAATPSGWKDTGRLGWDLEAAIKLPRVLLHSILSGQRLCISQPFFVVMK
jgi:hypothetical protein